MSDREIQMVKCKYCDTVSEFDGWPWECEDCEAYDCGDFECCGELVFVHVREKVPGEQKPIPK